jgi:hypothetical protein
VSLDPYEVAALRKLYLPDFSDLQRRRDGRWEAIHQTTGQRVDADTLRELVDFQAPLARIAQLRPDAT